MKELTKKQRRILEYISKKLLVGSCPSQRELAGHFGISQNAVFQLIRYLKLKGYLEVQKGHRGLKLTGGHWRDSFEKVPVLGSAITSVGVSVGRPVRRHINLNHIFSRASGTFFVKSAGRGVASSGIDDGDYVLIKPAESISDGDTALVLIENKIWLKKIVIRDDGIIFSSDYDKHKRKNISVAAGMETAKIVGKVIGCIKLPI